MADYAVSVVDGQVVVQPFGSSLITPLVAAAEAARDDAETAQTAAEAAQAAAEAAVADVSELEAQRVLDAAAIVRRNLFDVTASTDGFTVNTSTGLPQASTGYTISDFMPVVPGGTYTCTQAVGVAWYNASQTFISGVNAGFTANYVATAPAGAYFMRVSGQNAVAPSAGYQVTPGSTLSPVYVAFNQVVDGGKIMPTTVDGAAMKLNPNSWFMFPHNLRATRRALRARMAGDSLQIPVCTYGDSYSDGVSYWAVDTFGAMQTFNGGMGGTAPGFGGLGWCGFGLFGSIKGNLQSWLVTVARSGSGWTDQFGTQAYSPDTCSATSSTAGDKYTVTSISSNPVLSGFKFYSTGTGVARYRWNAGSWTTLNLTAGSGQQIDNLTGYPGTATWTFEIEVVSGTCVFCGCWPISAANGVIWHKVAASGRKIQDLAAADNTAMIASITAFAPTLVTIGTPINDRLGTRTPAQYVADLTTHITRVRTAAPAADILLFVPAEINGTYAPGNRMSDFADAVRQLAYDQRCAFIDFQPLFGLAYANYSSASTFPVMGSDGIHPSLNFGRRLMADAFIRAILGGAL